jgi:hypothetical protein
MLVLDENLPAGQQLLLRKQRIRVCSLFPCGVAVTLINTQLLVGWISTRVRANRFNGFLDFATLSRRQRKPLKRLGFCGATHTQLKVGC